jgi:hypothetical protein
MAWIFWIIVAIAIGKAIGKCVGTEITVADYRRKDRQRNEVYKEYGVVDHIFSNGATMRNSNVTQSQITAAHEEMKRRGLM